MGILEIALAAVWAWGAYMAWNKLTEKNNEWLNTKEPLNIIAKLALSIVMGFWQFVKVSVKIGLKIGRAVLG